MTRTLLMMLAAPLAFAQTFSFGVKAGARLMEAFDTARNANSTYASLGKSYTVGPVIQIGLPLRLAVEVDALYKRVGYAQILGGLTDGYIRTSGNSWEFPVLLKYRFTSSRVRPYVSGGPNFSALAGLKQLGQFSDLGIPGIV